MIILPAIFNASYIIDDYWHNKYNNQYNYAQFNETSPTPDTNWPSLLLVLFILSGVFGNTLVCIAVSTEKRLQNVTNYFLLSLSVADLLVCMLVMPFSILTVLNYGKWDVGFTLCAFHVYTDVFLCSASIVHMTAISLDRYLGISRPLKTRNKSKLIVFTKILIVWILTVVISCPLAVLFLHNPANIYMKMTEHDENGSLYSYYLCQINNRYYMIYGSTLAFLIPFLIMLITYLRTTNLLKTQAALLSSVSAAGKKSPNASAMAAAMAQDGLRRTRTKRSSTRTKNLHRQMYSVDEDSLATTCSLYTERPHGSSFTTNTLNAASVVRHSISMEDAVTFSSPMISTSSASCGTPRRKYSPKIPPEACSLLDSDAETDRYHNLLSAPNDKSPTLKSRLRTIVKQRRVAGGSSVELSNHHHHHNPSIHHAAAANDVANEQKATRVLGLVFACFFVCWTPFFALNFTYAFCADYCQAPFLVEMVFLWLGFVSSSINPIIYTVFNKNFRRTFARIVKCKWRKRRRNAPDSLAMMASTSMGGRRSTGNSMQQSQRHRNNKNRPQQKISLINACGSGIAYAVQRTNSSSGLTNGGGYSSSATVPDSSSSGHYYFGSRQNFPNSNNTAIPHL